MSAMFPISVQRKRNISNSGLALISHIFFLGLLGPSRRYQVVDDRPADVHVWLEVPRDPQDLLGGLLAADLAREPEGRRTVRVSDIHHATHESRYHADSRRYRIEAGISGH